MDVARGAYWRTFPDERGNEVRVSCPYRGRVRPRRQPFAIGEGEEEIVKNLKNMGFSYITLDIQGFRSGSMDENL